MKRPLSGLLLAAAAAAACVNLSDSGLQLLFVMAPVLDSVFVEDTLQARGVFLVDASGHQFNPGPIKWSISPTSVATIDSSGKIVGRSKGSALVIATRVDSVKSAAIVIVSRPLEVTTLMDTVYMMPGDTFTVPIAITQRTPGAPTLRFDPSPNAARYTIDTVSGLITGVGVGVGGAVPYLARLTEGTDTVSDTGAVVVMSLTDTSQTGRFFMTAFGTAIRHESGPAVALNYRRLDVGRAFQLSDTLGDGGTRLERVVITLPDSVIRGDTTFEIDSISPEQAEIGVNQLNPFCRPTFPWAVWHIALPRDFRVYSHSMAPDSIAGELSITQYVPVTGGAIISGRYVFQGRRNDLYFDPLGAETVRGTFVAPLRQRNFCPE